VPISDRRRSHVRQPLGECLSQWASVVALRRVVGGVSPSFHLFLEGVMGTLNGVVQHAVCLFSISGQASGISCPFSLSFETPCILHRLGRARPSSQKLDFSSTGNGRYSYSDKEMFTNFFSPISAISASCIPPHSISNPLPDYTVHGLVALSCLWSLFFVPSWQ